MPSTAFHFHHRRTARRELARGRAYPLALVLLAAGGALAMTMGARQSMGLFVGPINGTTGLGLASVSLAFAIGQLWWGLTQPFAGMVADRYGAGRVIGTGIVLVALGTALTPYMHTQAGLVLALGVIAAGGAGMAGVSVLMATTTRLVAPERRGIATGIVNAGGSFGQFAFAPMAQGLMVAFGWAGAMQGLALVVLLALPGAWVLRGSGLNAPGAARESVAQASTDAAVKRHAQAAQHPQSGGTAPEPATTLGPTSTRGAIAAALRDRSFLLLCAGFYICGFHVAFLATHMPGVVVQCGLPAVVGAWAISVIGLFNIVGSFAMGWAVGRWRMKSLLSMVYACRAAAVLIFVLAPKSTALTLVFAAVMGLTFLSTVPPTAGLVAKLHGPAYMGTLFGIVMLAHQIGGFCGAWLGGQSIERTGSYDAVWMLDIALALLAALLHLPIREQRLRASPALSAA